MIKKGDFIELDYLGKIKGTGQIFDLTSEKRAKEEKLFSEKEKYGSKIICVGENAIVKGIDEFIIGKETKQYTLELQPDKAFGKKDPKLMKIVPMNVFFKQKIRPFPGLQMNFDGLMGVVKAVSGGRVVVDFNHPLAGRDIIYELDIKRIITDDKEKVKGFLESVFGKVEYDYKENNVKIYNLQLPPEITDKLGNKIKEVIPSIKEVKFLKEKEKKSEEKPKEKKATVQP